MDAWCPDWVAPMRDVVRPKLEEAAVEEGKKLNYTMRDCASGEVAREPTFARPLLAVNNIEVIYDHVILVLKGVSLEVPEEGIVALLGANGAGKSTTLKAISGLLRTERGEVTKGGIELDGEAIHRHDPADVVRRGIVQVMEGRHVFEHLSVEENLLTGAYTRRNGRRDEARPRAWYMRTFPAWWPGGA